MVITGVTQTVRAFHANDGTANSSFHIQWRARGRESFYQSTCHSTCRWRKSDSGVMEPFAATVAFPALSPALSALFPVATCFKSSPSSPRGGEDIGQGLLLRFPAPRLSCRGAGTQTIEHRVTAPHSVVDVCHFSCRHLSHCAPSLMVPAPLARSCLVHVRGRRGEALVLKLLRLGRTVFHAVEAERVYLQKCGWRTAASTPRACPHSRSTFSGKCEALATSGLPTFVPSSLLSCCQCCAPASALPCAHA